MRQKFITKCVCFLLQNETVLLQNAKVIINCDNFITKCDFYYKLRQYNANKRAHDAKRSFCVCLMKKAKKGILATKRSGKIYNIFFLEKESITLLKNGEILSSSQDVSDTLSTFFSDLVKDWSIPLYEDPTLDTITNGTPF